MTRITFATLAAIGFVSLAAQAAFADQSSNRKTCNTENGQAAIVACTALIRSGKLSPRDLSGVYASRSSDYSYAGQYALGVRDADKAIKIDSHYAVAYASRGVAEYFLKQYRAALDDFSHAIRLKPDDANYYQFRSMTEEAMGQKDAADNDETKACLMDTNLCN